jgi:hypothetical protein
VTREEAEALAERENARGREGVVYEVAGPEDVAVQQFALGSAPAVSPFFVRRRFLRASGGKMDSDVRA